MFKLTPAAADQVRRAAEQIGTSGMDLRLAARHQANNNGIDYLMGFDEVKEDDIRFQSEGVYILIAPEYAPLLNETVMDFVEMEPGVRQFIFLNPQDPEYVPPQN